QFLSHCLNICSVSHHVFYLLPRVLSFFSLFPPPPRSPLFPYTTLFRSSATNYHGRTQASWALVIRRISDSALIHSAGGNNTATKDRKSTRLNSSHRTISYAVFCLKKKTDNPPQTAIYTSLISATPIASS